MHLLITGMTRCGKSKLAKTLARQLKQNGWGIIVLEAEKFANPQDWGFADRYLKDPEEFDRTVQRSRRCICIAEEAGEYLTNHEKRFHWWGTGSRHFGHTFFFITQRPQMISLTVRGQVDVCYIFRSGHDALLEISKDYNTKRVFETIEYERGQYMKVPKFGDIQEGRIF